MKTGVILSIKTDNYYERRNKKEKEREENCSLVSNLQPGRPTIRDESGKFAGGMKR